jgi:transcriptional regulator with XRE-family HTH domain
MKSESEILLEARKRLGLTQQQVANQARILLQQYQKFESGERKLSSSSFWLGRNVLVALNLDVSTFANGGYAAVSTNENCES